MNCGFCGREIDIAVLPGPAEGERSCGGCLGGCRKIHCPYCGYANPAPGKLLSRFLAHKNKSKRQL